MNFILKNISVTFSNLKIFPDSEIKLKIVKKYEEVEIKISKRKSLILSGGVYPDLIKKIRGNFIYYKKNKKFHRNYGPAVICFEDNRKIIYEEYYQDGKLNRAFKQDKPSCIFYKDGKVSREEYYQDGKLNRPFNDKPTLICYKDGKISREEYYQNGKLNRPSNFTHNLSLICYKNGNIIYEKKSDKKLSDKPSFISYDDDGKVTFELFY